MFRQRKIGDKIFHYARTEETKEEARKTAKELRNKGYKARVFPVKFLMSNAFEIYIYPEEQINISRE